MTLGRRSLLFGLGALIATGPVVRAQQSDEDYAPFEFNDIFAGVKGPISDSDPNDLVKVGIIVGLAPTDNFASIMEYLASIDKNRSLGENAIGSTGEYFNTRWKKIANPLLIKFFHDIGYKNTPMAGDCTPWCAATISWALKRSGRDLPNDPASSQSFLHGYGRKLDFPHEQPQSGDLCVFTDIDDHAHGHVGAWRKFTANQSSVVLLAGNQDGSGPTQCPAGYPKSRIDERTWAMNLEKDRTVSTLYFNAFVRPPA
jgi:hypothetical protein